VEQIEFTYPANRRANKKPTSAWWVPGTLKSCWNLAKASSPRFHSDQCGWLPDTWKAVLDRFFAKYTVLSAFKSTTRGQHPASSLRLEQAVEVSER